MQAAINSGTPWTYNYAADAQGQLTGDGTNTYDYDLNGNRDTGYTYYQNPDEVHYTNEIETDGTWHYYYDANGNTVKKVNITEGDDAGVTWVYGYDNANHLILAQKWSADPDVDEEADLELSVSYKYNAFGEKIEEDVADGPTIKYAIDGWNPALPTPVGNENMNVLARLDGSDDLTNRYVYGDQVDQQLGRVDWTGSEFEAFGILTDHLGSVRDVIDNTGTVKDSIAYDSFGNIQSSELNPSFRGWYAWTGRELDQNIDLQYNHARWYDGQSGRWSSQDPMGFGAGDSNLYRYVKNAPTLANDASGLQPSPVTLQIDMINLMERIENTERQPVYLKLSVTMNSNNSMSAKITQWRPFGEGFTFQSVVAGVHDKSNGGDNYTSGWYDTDSVQVAVQWLDKDGNDVAHVTNAKPQQKRDVGADWVFGKSKGRETATWNPDGTAPASATKMNAVFVYTDALNTHADLAIVIGSFSASREKANSPWKLVENPKDVFQEGKGITKQETKKLENDNWALMGGDDGPPESRQKLTPAIQSLQGKTAKIVKNQTGYELKRRITTKGDRIGYGLNSWFDTGYDIVIRK